MHERELWHVAWSFVLQPVKAELDQRIVERAIAHPASCDARDEALQAIPRRGMSSRACHIRRQAVQVRQVFG